MPIRNQNWPHSLKAALLLMVPFDLLASLAMDIYLPVVPAMPDILGTTPAVVQLTLSLYMVLLGAGQLLFGPLADRIGRRPIVIAGGILFVIASFALAASNGPGMFLMFRVFQALGASAALVATFATVRDVYAERPEGTTIYALFSAILAFVPALGPILGALLAAAWGWRAIFLVLGVAAAAAVLNAAAGWKETRLPGTGAPLCHLRRPLRARRFWTYTLGFSAAMGTFFVFFSTAPRVLIDLAGYSPFAFSVAFSSVALVMMLMTRCVGRWRARWGDPGCLARGMTLLLAGALLLVLGQVFGSPSFIAFIAPMWVSATGIVMTVAVTANGALKGFDDMAGSAVALYFCVQSVLVAIAGTAAVLLGGDSAWPLVGYSTGMAVLVLLALARTRDEPGDAR